MKRNDSLFTSLVVGLVGIAASYYASKIVKEMLDEKPFGRRVDDWKETAKAVQIKVTDGVLNAVDDLKKRASKTDVQ